MHLNAFNSQIKRVNNVYDSFFYYTSIFCLLHNFSFSAHQIRVQRWRNFHLCFNNPGNNYLTHSLTERIVFPKSGKQRRTNKQKEGKGREGEIRQIDTDTTRALREKIEEKRRKTKNKQQKNIS